MKAPLPCHSYIFFDIEPGKHTAPKPFEKSVRRIADLHGVAFHSYATLGFKAGTRFMLHLNAATPEAIQLFIRDVLHTPLGGHLILSYALFGMTRPSPYKPPAGAQVELAQEGRQKDPEPAAADQPHRYLIVYPFTKTIEWHLLPLEERRAVMKAHVEVGRRWSKTVSQLLLYSYGLDDHEFVVSYYTDSLEDFQSLVMDMRATESRRHTKSDTPIFLCIHMPLGEALSMI